MDKKRYKSVIALWGIIFICLQAITIVNVFGINPGGYTETAKIVSSIKSVIPSSDIKKGAVSKALIVRTKKEIRRLTVLIFVLMTMLAFC